MRSGTAVSHPRPTKPLLSPRTVWEPCHCVNIGRAGAGRGVGWVGGLGWREGYRFVVDKLALRGCAKCWFGHNSERYRKDRYLDIKSFHISMGYFQMVQEMLSLTVDSCVVYQCHSSGCGSFFRGMCHIYCKRSGLLIC